MAKFNDLGILPDLESALTLDKITEPTAIQVKAIPALLAGKSAYLSSETGSGKTLAYLLPLLSQIDPEQRSLQAIVIVPTHELAMQISNLGHALTQKSGLKIRLQVLIGGVSIKRQVEKLKSKPHLIIGTAGRINELIDVRKIKPHTVKTIVVDEVDRLLFGDSLVAVSRIIKSTLRGRQLVFVSATQQLESSHETEDLAPDLVQIHVGCNQINSRIEHSYLVCQEHDKPEMLRKLLSAIGAERAIIFVHRNTSAEEITTKLGSHGVTVVSLHGTQDKLNRKKAIDDFRKAAANVMVASDMAARGLDICGVSHVVNFDVPTQSKDYLHRVGRTSRAGSLGHAISLMTEQDARLIKRLQTELNISIHPGRLYRGNFKVDEKKKAIFEDKGRSGSR